ncbi:8-oxo-dGTP diphosphatase [Psychrobacillus sp. NEAU-3TGS]|uniref:NUDIX hydrolase n=1 Tax=Psychrobacillus sp. NEAU-3TGS TaxID=2995412 RepID=UPI002496C606|nr:8-oxo-dGTP diphosphatase [Psychrobacillus sp. NEAU-3TGS]MDI2588578.1 8-oxo-dGTP diphosphatase [Psychrobacillus sp. NEAU-3TGS]
MFKYNVCFLKSNERILMLNREKPPIMGVWNGVGGKYEAGECADEGAKREVFEETGIKVNEYYSKCVITWSKSDEEKEGLHVYLFEVNETLGNEPIQKTREGILDWKEIEWIMHPNNLGIAEMVTQYLPVLLAKEGDYQFEYIDGIVKLMKTSTIARR